MFIPHCHMFIQLSIKVVPKTGRGCTGSEMHLKELVALSFISFPHFKVNILTVNSQLSVTRGKICVSQHTDIESLLGKKQPQAKTPEAVLFSQLHFNNVTSDALFHGGHLIRSAN